LLNSNRRTAGVKASESPAAQSGREKAANPLPFAPVPYALLKDTRLTPTDKMIAALVLEWLFHSAPAGWVSNQSLAEGANVSVRTVQYALQRLQATGWLRCDLTESNETHRLITALWRVEGFTTPVAEGAKAARGCMVGYAARCTAPTQPIAYPPLQPVAPKQESGNKKEEEDEETASSSFFSAPPGEEERTPAVTVAPVMPLVSAPPPASPVIHGAPIAPDTPTTPAAVPDPAAVNRTVAAVADLFGATPSPYKRVAALVKQGTPPEWIEQAVREAAGKRAKEKTIGWGYVLGILKNWRDEDGPMGKAEPKKRAPQPPLHVLSPVDRARYLEREKRKNDAAALAAAARPARMTPPFAPPRILAALAAKNGPSTIPGNGRQEQETPGS
jgi:hypothetical protein